MHPYTFRYFHRDGFLTHRVQRQCASLRDALQWSGMSMSEDFAILEILDGETLVWRGTEDEARASIMSAA